MHLSSARRGVLDLLGLRLRPLLGHSLLNLSLLNPSPRELETPDRRLTKLSLRHLSSLVRPPPLQTSHPPLVADFAELQWLRGRDDSVRGHEA